VIYLSNVILYSVDW